MIIFWKNLDTGSLNVPADVWAYKPIEDLGPLAALPNGADINDHRLRES